jgi:hypothetical protein
MVSNESSFCALLLEADHVQTPAEELLLQRSNSAIPTDSSSDWRRSLRMRACTLVNSSTQARMLP